MEKVSESLNARTPFLPTPAQQLLLQACLFNGEEAIGAWRSWRAAVNIDELDMGSIRLLPLLAEKLSRLGLEDPCFGVYRGVQRRTWARNQLLFHGGAKVVRRFQEAGVAVLVLKGAVLASTCYETMSLRPMGDLDFLVKRVDAANALDELERLGWRVQAPNKRPRVRADFAVRQACAFEDASNPEVSVDLHWRLLWARQSDEAEAALWARAVWFEIGGAQCLAPCAADMLIHVCAHAVGWADFPPVRWVVDAALLLRRRAIDWDYLCLQSARLGLNIPISATLEYLRSAMRAPIPEGVLRMLARGRPRSIDRLLYETEVYPPEKRSVLTALRIHTHVACCQLVPTDGVVGYWQYFSALRNGRSLGEMAAWVRGHLTANRRV